MPLDFIILLCIDINMFWDTSCANTITNIIFKETFKVLFMLALCHCAINNQTYLFVPFCFSLAYIFFLFLMEYWSNSTSLQWIMNTGKSIYETINKTSSSSSCFQSYMSKVTFLHSYLNFCCRSESLFGTIKSSWACFIEFTPLVKFNHFQPLIYNYNEYQEKGTETRCKKCSSNCCCNRNRSDTKGEEGRRRWNR